MPLCVFIEAPVGDFTSETSFIEWEIKELINTTFSPDSFEITHLGLQFRTRQDNGVIFEANSFSTLERIILEVRKPTRQLSLNKYIVI